MMAALLFTAAMALGVPVVLYLDWPLWVGSRLATHTPGPRGLGSDRARLGRKRAPLKDAVFDNATRAKACAWCFGDRPKKRRHSRWCSARCEREHRAAIRKGVTW